MTMNVHPTSPTPFPLPHQPYDEKAEKEKYVVGTLRLIGSDERSDAAPTRKKLSDSLSSSSHMPKELLAYFNAHFSDGSIGQAQQILQAWEIAIPFRNSTWRAFQADCEKVRPQLKNTLKKLEQSWIRNYLFRQENEQLQERYRETMYQVHILERESAVPCRTTDRSWQWLEAAIDKVDEVGVETARLPPESSTDATSVPAPSLGAAASLWEEAYYFLAPVVTTVWGILNKLGVLAETLTKNVPLVGGLISLMLTTQQRATIWLKKLKTEDRDQLISICKSLTTSFETIRSTQFMERIDRALTSQGQILNSQADAFDQLASQAESQTENTAKLLQHADTVRQEIAQLRQENALFKEELSAHFKEKLEQIIALLTNRSLPTTPSVDKRA